MRCLPRSSDPAVVSQAWWRPFCSGGVAQARDLGHRDGRCPDVMGLGLFEEGPHPAAVLAVGQVGPFPRWWACRTCTHSGANAVTSPWGSAAPVNTTVPRMVWLRSCGVAATSAVATVFTGEPLTTPLSSTHSSSCGVTVSRSRTSQPTARYRAPSWPAVNEARTMGKWLAGEFGDGCRLALVSGR